MGSNVDGKPRRLLAYIGGVATKTSSVTRLQRTATKASR
jgi:hypothetical protein